LVKLQRAHGG